MATLKIKEIVEITEYARSEFADEGIASNIFKDAGCIVMKDGLKCRKSVPCISLTEGKRVQVNQTWTWCDTGWNEELYKDRTQA